MANVQCRFAAISASNLSPLASSFSLLYNNSSRVSVENSWFCAVNKTVVQYHARYKCDIESRHTLDNGINGTSLLAESTVDALGHVDIYRDN
jgi:hypothetical protein